MQSLHDIKRLSRDDLAAYVAENLKSLMEDEAQAVLANPFVTTPILQSIGQNQRLTGFYSVRVRLAAHRATPQAQAVKLVYYLHWPDLLRLSVDVKVPSPVRRAIDTQLVLRLEKTTLGERVSSARLCSRTLIKELLFDPEPRVLSALLLNPRLREDDLLSLTSSPAAPAEHLRIVAGDQKWSYRYAIRKALVTNPRTPRAAAASQLRYLSRRDLEQIRTRPDTSVFLRMCIERLMQAPRRGGELTESAG